MHHKNWVELQTELILSKTRLEHSWFRHKFTVQTGQCTKYPCLAWKGRSFTEN